MRLVRHREGEEHRGGARRDSLDVILEMDG